MLGSKTSLAEIFDADGMNRGSESFCLDIGWRWPESPEMVMTRYLGMLALLGGSALMISSCAIAPAGLKRSVSRAEKTICRLDLEELLLLALEKPNTGRSAHALGHFVERWKAEKNNAISGTLKIAHGEPSAMTYHIKIGRAHV